MAERVEDAEAEVSTADAELSAAAALALGLRGSRRSSPSKDAKLDAFLEKQGRLVDIQTEHLHEQRALILSRLRWGRFSDRIKAALQLMTMAVGLAVAGAVAVMAWQAHEDHGVVIETFSVPPDLAQRGMTGQVVASELLDGLAAMQAKTVTARPASTYANDWGGDIKVEIPETGVSIGELNRFLRDWLGSETKITGEVVRTAAGVAVTARAGEAPGQRFEGTEADLDNLIGRAAEAVYASTQPYRYAVWLSAQGRRDEALAAYARLATSGPSEERAWAYAGWATLLYLEARRASAADRPTEMAEAVRLAGVAKRLEPRLWPAWPIHGNGLWNLGRAEDAEAQVRREIAMHRRGEFIGLPRSLSASRLMVMRGVDAFQTGDYQSAVDLIRKAATRIDVEGQADAWDGSGVMARALASDHDVTASRRAPGAAAATSEQAAALDDWASQVPRLQSGRGGPRGRAELYAHLGRFAEAERLIAGTPTDCYPCLRVRGLVAALQHDWPAADRWYAEAARQAPSLPFAHTEWGQALLAKGDLDGAIAKLAEAHRRSPHFADPLELWGEALMAKRDYAGAIGKFTEADKYAPRWGRNHMLWGEALMLTGRYAEARAQYEAAGGMDLSRPDRAALDVLLARTAKGRLHG